MSLCRSVTGASTSTMAASGARLTGCRRAFARSLRLSGSSTSIRRICSTGAKADGDIDPPDLKELAGMAHIGVTDAEVEEWTPKIAGIVDWFGQLREADVESVQPALRGLSSDDATREDVPVEFAGREEMLSNATHKEDVYIKVPKITTEADG